jgi:hypothetical protein
MQNSGLVPHSPLKKAVIGRHEAIEEKYSHPEVLSWELLKMHKRKIRTIQRPVRSLLFEGRLSLNRLEVLNF